LLCYLRLHPSSPLAQRGCSRARTASDVPPDEATRENSPSSCYSRKSVAATGLLALHPVLRTRRRDLVQLYLPANEILQLPDHAVRQGLDAPRLSGNSLPVRIDVLDVATRSILMARAHHADRECSATQTGGSGRVVAEVPRMARTRR